ncbi:type IX secretion system periplasmic lipoprotein PorW/SprE [Solitalea canadensis]|nr:tetratricopeptide repeat protein [Solitalea canadensis]
MGNRIGVVKGSYHNTTARFNAYFNAKEIFRKDVSNFESGYTISYSNVLPLLKLPDEGASSGMAANMDQIIEKCSKVVTRHKVSKWTDDSYMLVGKAYFYKGDYFDAAQTFQYIYNTFPNKDLKEEALAWIGLSKMQDKMAEDATAAFEMAEANIADAKKSKRFVYTAMAQYYINRKSYDKAASSLENAIKAIKKDKLAKINYSYVLGQIYEKQGDYAKAVESFKKVQGLRAPYEMELAAKINAFRLTNLTEGGNTSDLIRKLNDLLDDEKNSEYKDQIYFVLGAIAQRTNQPDSAISLYKLSAANTGRNLNQKALSYSQIAEIYFNRKDYDKAHLYYDSTRVFVQRDHPDYEKIIERDNKLDDLIANIKIIDREDSLQHVAALPEPERTKIIDEQVAKIQSKIRESKVDQSQYSSSYNTLAINRFNNAESGGSSWYFYNNNAVASGYNEFIRRWGNRQLADNWRISSQGVANTKIFDTDPGFDLKSIDAAQPDKIKAFLVKNLPLTPAKLDSSNQIKQNAALKLAAIYSDDLEEYASAIKYYELALNTPPPLHNADEIIYNLSYINELAGNKEQSAAYKNRLLNQYPGSSFANALRNPEASQVVDITQTQAEQQYEMAYKDYLNRDYEKVIASNKDFQLSKANTYLKSKFAFLSALAVGKTQKVGSFEAELKKVQQEYPNEEASKQAGQFIASIDNNRAEFDSREIALEERSIATATDAASISKRYEDQRRLEDQKREQELAEAESKSYFKKPAPNASYVLVVAVNNATANLNRIRLGIGQFNRTLFADKNYTHNSKTINNETQLISVNQFADMETAKAYYKKFMEYRNDVIGLPDEKYTVFFITTDNFARLINQTTVEEYRDYFRINF